MQDFHVAGLVALGRFPLLFPVAVLSIKEVFFFPGVRKCIQFGLQYFSWAANRAGSPGDEL